MKYALQDSAGKQIAGNLLPPCMDCMSANRTGKTSRLRCPADGQTRRSGLVVSSLGRVWMCSPLKEDIESKRLFLFRMNAHLSVLQHVAEMRAELAASFNQKLTHLLHNLTSLNAHAIQDVYALVDQEVLTKQLTEQLKLIQNAMKASPSKAARTFLRIAKNNLAMKSEFAAMRFLDETSPRPRFRNHPIRKVVLNVLHSFFPDFTDHQIRVTVHDCAAIVPLDYDSFHCAIYHLIDNAAKYAMPDSEIIVAFVDGKDQFRIVFDMLSLRIPADEVSRIGDEWFSGSLPRSLDLAGNGVGMFRAKRLLAANDGRFLIEANIAPERARKHDGVWYEENRFTVVLEKSSRRRFA